MPVFWTSGDVGPLFQSQCGSTCTHVQALVGLGEMLMYKHIFFSKKITCLLFQSSDLFVTDAKLAILASTLVSVIGHAVHNPISKHYCHRISRSALASRRD